MKTREVLVTCKYCKKNYDLNEVERKYGIESTVYVLRYCSAQCYTNFKFENPPLSDLIDDSLSELKIAECCGSCVHTSKPKKLDNPHAAHYEVAKTERWCFKHNIHTYREAVCGEHEGYNRGTKSNLNRIKKFNSRLDTIKKIISLIGIDEVLVAGKIFSVEKNKLMYRYENAYEHEPTLYNVSSKSAIYDDYFKIILEKYEQS